MEAHTVFEVNIIQNNQNKDTSWENGWILKSKQKTHLLVQANI